MNREAPPPLTLRDLAKAQGLLRLNKALGGGHEDMAKIMVMSSKYLKDDPDLAPLTVGLSTGGDFYDITKNRVGLTSSNPNVFAHEVGHAKDLADSSGLYKNVILRGSRKVNHLLGLSSLPIATAIATSNLSDAAKDKILKGGAAISALTAAPNLTAEAAASINAVKHSPSKMNTLYDMLPGGASHLLKDLGGMGAYLAVNAVRKGQIPPSSLASLSALGSSLPA